MKMEKESKALLEVRKWKKAVAKEAQGLSVKERLEYYNKVLKIDKSKKAA